MCSIFGVVAKEELCYKQSEIEDAFALLAHRGPDSSKRIVSKNYFFGAHRLAIESFGREQKQPIEKDGYIALFNGEIYNYKALIAEYKLDISDEIELILALFTKFGEAFVQRLRGMFAIAIYKQESGKLWLFHDLIGKKPLYYTFNERSFLFASEIKALQALQGSNFDKRALHQFLGFGATVAPKTLDKNIYKLPPASILYFDGESVVIESYDTILEQRHTITSKEYAQVVIRQQLEEAVRVRIPQKVAWGVLLSGGLDSSLVAALAAKESAEAIDTFSIGYEGYTKYDERPFAKELADSIGAKHHSIEFTKVDFFATLDELLKFIDDPIGDPAQIPLYFLIKQAKKQGIKVLLSGDGSDELFLGYRTYKEYFMMESVKNLPYANWLKNHLRANFSMNKEWEWYKRALNKEVVFRSSAEIYTDRQLNMLLRLQERDGKNFEALSSYWERFSKSGRDIIDWYSYCDLKVQLAELFLVKIDRVSMAAGVEVRSPFIDRSVVESAFDIDTTLRFTPDRVKDILKELGREYLPEATIERKKKGLNYPFIEWILEEDGIKSIYEANREFRFLNEEHLNFLSSKASQGKFKQHLFPLYMLSRWLLR